MRLLLGFVAILIVATMAIGQDLCRRTDFPGELIKELPWSDSSRSASGRLPAPPPSPPRSALALAALEGDREAILEARLATQTPEIAFIVPGEDDEWTEGEEVQLRWRSSGPIEGVRIYFYGGKCRLGGRDRGMFQGYITKSAPDSGSFTWQVPWIDALSLNVRIAGLGEDGESLADAEQTVRFRPKELADLADESGSVIVVIKSRQRLYLQQAGKLVRQHMVSTAAGGYWTPTMKPGSYDRRRGAMGKVFGKSGRAWSRQYECWMPYWMAITSSGSHGIHATSRPFYRRLGSPASHGCIRQHHADAKVLYSMVSVGTPVYVLP